MFSEFFSNILLHAPQQIINFSAKKTELPISTLLLIKLNFFRFILFYESAHI